MRTWLQTKSTGIALAMLLATLGVAVADFTAISAVLLTLAFGLALNPLIDREGVRLHLMPGLDFTLGIPLQIGTGLLGHELPRAHARGFIGAYSYF